MDAFAGEFFCCDGGPHMVLPVALSASWGGVDFEDILNPESDYGRACAVADPIAPIQLNSGAVLILGQSPAMSAWSRSSDSEVNLFVLEAWQTDDIAALLTEAAKTQTLRNMEFQWEVPAPGDAYLMYAGDTVESAAYGHSLIPLPAGTYNLSEAIFENSDGRVHVFKLRRA